VRNLVIWSPVARDLPFPVLFQHTSTIIDHIISKTISDKVGILNDIVYLHSIIRCRVGRYILQSRWLLKNVVLGDVTPSNVKEILPTFQRKFWKFLPEWMECIPKGRIIQGRHRDNLNFQKDRLHFIATYSTDYKPTESMQI